MAYTPTVWKDRDVENPRTYTARQNEDGSITFFDAPGEIREQGTPVNAVNMNKIEQGIVDAQRVIGDIGDVYYTLRTDVPAGGAWCDGALYTKAQFPDVYQMLVDGKLQSTTVSNFDSTVSANGSCGFFGLDTSNERFKVPMLKDVYIKAGDVPSMFGAESLPNIKGAISCGVVSEPHQEGALYREEEKQGYDGAYAGVDRGMERLMLDASRSSSTYQDGAKVNPDHVVYRAYVVLYASAAEASVAQAQEFMTALGGKANVALDNVPSNIDYVVESWTDGISFYRKFKSGWLEQGRFHQTIDSGTNQPYTFTLIQPFKTAQSYEVHITSFGTDDNTTGPNITLTNRETTFITIVNQGHDTSVNHRSFNWYAFGQGA